MQALGTNIRLVAQDGSVANCASILLYRSNDRQTPYIQSITIYVIETRYTVTVLLLFYCPIDIILL